MIDHAVFFNNKKNIRKCSRNNYSIKIRTRITTNSNLSQHPNRSIIQNFKNSKLFKPSKYKKTSKFVPKKFLNINHYEKPTKKEERQKATFQNPFLLFLSFVHFCLYYPQHFLLVSSFILRSFFSPNLVVFSYFEGSNSFEFLKFQSIE